MKEAKPSGFKGIIKGRFVPAGLFALLLWVQASLPAESLQRIQTAPKSSWLSTILSDQFMHFLVFGLLTLLIFMGFYRESKWSVPFVKVAAIASVYGFLIEVYQGILPWRSFGFDDLVWNTVGVLFFQALVGIVAYLSRRKVLT